MWKNPVLVETNYFYLYLRYSEVLPNFFLKIWMNWFNKKYKISKKAIIEWKTFFGGEDGREAFFIGLSVFGLFHLKIIGFCPALGSNVPRIKKKKTFVKILTPFIFILFFILFFWNLASRTGFSGKFSLLF